MTPSFILLAAPLLGLASYNLGFALGNRLFGPRG